MFIKKSKGSELPSVTSPKEEKASFRDFSSTDQDRPVAHLLMSASQQTTAGGDNDREKEE